jgi:hypothetical protein
MIVAPVCKQNPYTVTPECIHQQRNEKSIKSISTRDCAQGARDEIKKRTKANEVVEIQREEVREHKNALSEMKSFNALNAAAALASEYPKPKYYKSFVSICSTR